MSHTHLDKIQAVNLGSFYTPDFAVQIAQTMLLNALNQAGVNPKDCTLLDSSCGYGNFLDFSGVINSVAKSQHIDFQSRDFALDFASHNFTIQNLAQNPAQDLSQDFADFALKIGIDIDKTAIEIAKSNFNPTKSTRTKQDNINQNLMQNPQATNAAHANQIHAQNPLQNLTHTVQDSTNHNPANPASNPPLFLHQNALLNVSRKAFKIPLDTPLAVIGNPPYNDKTSIVQNKLKDKIYALDSHLKCRDIGASFLLSFDALKADFICVLHPLSYLIKETNFRALKPFFTHYALQDSLIISSRIFTPKSLSFFPIIIALYTRKKTPQTLEFSEVKRLRFHTIEGKSFALNDFDFIARYIDKYPNKSRVPNEKSVALFYTLRDINALRRSKTFLQKRITNAINVSREKFSLYCYVDVFKQMIDKVPYYLGNCDVLIDFEAFKILESQFVECAKSKIITPSITRYFENLLGEHYADC